MNNGNHELKVETVAQLATPPCVTSSSHTTTTTSSVAAAAAGDIASEELIREEAILCQPYDYISKLPGKQIRAHLAVAFNHWLKVPEDKLSTIMEITKMLHNASLLVDDIEDSSKLRRGIPVAHHIYGTPATLNCANYVYFLGLQMALTLGHPEVTKVFTEQMIELHKGQGMDIHWRDTFSCPTEEQYKRMVIKKTGGLFGLAIRLMQLFSDDERNLKPLLDNLGLYFQIRDDFANLYSEDYQKNKSYAEDLTEGKFSFPTIFAIRNSAECSSEISNILRQHTTDKDVKKFCIDKLRECGAFQYTVKTLKNLELQLKQQIELLGGNDLLCAIVDKLSSMYTTDESVTATSSSSETASSPSVTAAPSPSVTAAPSPSVTAAPSPSFTAAPSPSVTAAPSPSVTAHPV